MSTRVLSRPLPRSAVRALTEVVEAPYRLQALSASPEVVAHAELLAAQAGDVVDRRHPDTLRLRELADQAASLVALHRLPSAS